MTTESLGSASGASSSGPRANDGFLVNGEHYNLADRSPTARQILVAATFIPADECILVQLDGKASNALGLDDVVNLKGHGEEVFRAFRGDRVFRFTLSGLGCEWGVEKITEPDLREIAQIDEDQVIILERDGKDRELTSDDVVEVGRQGTEHLRVERGYVTVKYDGEDVRIHRGRYTTEQLVAIFKVPAGYLLNLVNEHNILVPLKPSEVTRVKSGMKFVSQVPGGASS